MFVPLNSQNLPYPDPLHPIILHFVIAMVFFSFFCDVVGYLTHKHHLFEVSFWNMFVASICIFLTVIFGQLEAGLAQPYEAAKPVLNSHTATGWLLAAIVVAITTWRFVIRVRDPLKIPAAYHGFYVPQFRIKKDILPNRTITFVFTPWREGKYRLKDSQFSGTYFALMETDVYVESLEAYSRWLAQAASRQPEPANNPAVAEYTQKLHDQGIRSG